MSVFRNLCCLLSAMMLFSFVGNATAQNIILNPGLELGSGIEIDDWLQVVGAAGTTTRDDANPNSGTYAAFLEFDHFINPAAPTPYAIEQIQTVGSIDDSENYNLSFSARVETLNFEGINIFYQILWLDQDASDGGGVRGESLVELVPAGISTEYQEFGLSDIDVPDGTDSFQLRFQLSPGAVEDIGNGFYIDDVSLAVTSDGGPLAGDFDLDGNIDGNDFLVWQQTDGSSTGLSEWQTAFGSGALAATIAIPEPSTLALILGSFFILANQRSSRLR